jgi:hypothetical protein
VNNANTFRNFLTFLNRFYLRNRSRTKDKKLGRSAALFPIKNDDYLTFVTLPVPLAFITQVAGV